MFDSLKEKLVGPFYTIFTPFGADEQVNYDELEKYLTLLYRQGARRFYAMAYNSRYSQLDNDEIIALNSFCIRTVKGLDPENIVVVGDPIHCSTRTTVDVTLRARDEGADLVSLIMREKHFTDEQVLDHFAEVGRKTKTPILVHEMPFLSGYDGTQMHWPASLVTSLPKIPEIAALKEDAHDREMTTLALGLEPRIRIIIAGRKSALLHYRKLGARAYLNGISIIDARIGERFWAAFETGDEAQMAQICDRLEAPFFDRCAAEYGWHRVNKALLQAAGLMHRRDRMPLKHLSDEEYILVETVYRQIVEEWKTMQGET